MVELHNAVGRAAASTQTGVSVRIGAQYPSRALLVNPAPPESRLRTTDPAAVDLSGAVATAPETRDRWDGSRRSFSTRQVMFEPSYNRIDARPVVATGAAVFRDATPEVTFASQRLVRDTHISLVTLSGDVVAGGLDARVLARPVSPAVRTVAVTGADTDADGVADRPIVLSLPTRLSVERWQGLLASEPNARARDGGPDRVEIVLRPTDGDGATVSATQNVTLTAEVRDRFDSPRSRVAVDVSAPEGQFSNGADDITVRTGVDGRASVTYDPPGGGDYVVTASGDFDDSGSVEADERAEFLVQVSDDSDGSDGSGDETTGDSPDEGPRR